MRFDTFDDFWEYVKKCCKGKKIYIWGISIYGNLLGRFFDENGISWDGYYDNFNSIDGNRLNSKPVYKGDEMDISEDAFYILSMSGYGTVERQLLSMGIKAGRIIAFERAQVLDSIEDRMTGYSVSTERLKSFHNKHEGSRCFVIGNGPSLCIEDLDKIYRAGIMSYACNLIFKCYDKTPWRPDYYFFTDGVGIRKTFCDRGVLEYASQNCKYMFSRSNGDLAGYVNELDNLILFKQAFSEHSEEKYDFSSECSEKVYIGHTVTYVMLQMAAYMGFKEIYLLGMDHSASIDTDGDDNIVVNGDHNHSKILGDYPLWGLPNFARVSRVYRSAKEYCDSNGIKIYNATRGGKLEIFERKNFDELFKEG